MARSLPRRQETGGLKDKKEKNYEKGVSEAGKKMEGSMAQKRSCGILQERENAAGQRCIAKGKKVTLLETIRRCMRQIS